MLMTDIEVLVYMTQKVKKKNITLTLKFDISRTYILETNIYQNDYHMSKSLILVRL